MVTSPKNFLMHRLGWIDLRPPELVSYARVYETNDSQEATIYGDSEERYTPILKNGEQMASRQSSIKCM